MGSGVGGAFCGARIFRLGVIAFSTILAASSTQAQRHRVVTAPASRTDMPQQVVVTKKQATYLPPDESCYMWQAGNQVATVSVTELKAPDNARKEVRSACSALRKKKLAQAEEHFRKATNLYPAYASAYVMLGEALEADKQPKEAHEVYEKAIAADPKYLLPVLCLADMEARDFHWQTVLQLSNRAVDIDPANANDYFYNGLAHLRLGHPADAEKQALRAAEIDLEHRDPRIQLLLAEIYEKKGDRSSAVAQLRTYLQLDKNEKTAEQVKAHLARLEQDPHR